MIHKKKILVFGNPVLEIDNISFKVAEKLKKDVEVIKKYEFENCYDLSKVIENDDFIILDAVSGINNVQLIDVSNLEASNIYSLHDFDLGFFLKLKQELGKLTVKIIGIPQKTENKNIMNVVEDVKKLI